MGMRYDALVVLDGALVLNSGRYNVPLHFLRAVNYQFDDPDSGIFVINKDKVDSVLNKILNLHSILKADSLDELEQEIEMDQEEKYPLYGFNWEIVRKLYIEKRDYQVNTMCRIAHFAGGLTLAKITNTDFVAA